MGLFQRFMSQDIDTGVNEYRQTKDAVLLDVRTPEEYASGHIPQSKNLSLQAIEAGQTPNIDKETPLFLYCRSGSRSGKATQILKNKGYTNVKKTSVG